MIRVQFLTGILILGSAQLAHAACTQTLNPGANVTTAISNAASGSTICLNAGSYPNIKVFSVNKTNDVTLQSSSGKTASVSVNIEQSNHIKLQSLTITSLEIDTNQNGGTKNVSILNNTFTGQAVINTANNSNANILINGNTFDGINVCPSCYEGRLEVISNPFMNQPSGVVISNNHFGGSGESDGIQIGAYGVVITGNTFDGIIQGSYSRHVDALQLYGSSHTTIVNNIFKNGDTYVMAPDGGNTEVFKNNIFVGHGSYVWKIQLGSHSDDIFSHNTLIGSLGASFDKKVGSTNSSNILVQNNIVMGGALLRSTDSSGAESCTGCTFSYNLFSSSPRGTNYLVGTPTFVGGDNPATWSGYQLKAGSLGYKSGSDGLDMGSNYYGPAASSLKISAPSNFRVFHH
jgi:hypothetical protein